MRINPAHGVKTPKAPPQRIRAIPPQDAARVLAHLPGPVSRIFVELDLHTELRWGEITELRGRDVRDDDHDELRVYLACSGQSWTPASSTPGTAPAFTSRRRRRTGTTGGWACRWR